MGTNTKTGFVEFRHIHCKGILPNTSGITLRFAVNQDENKLRVSWAICTAEDNFNRYIGRLISTGTAKTRFVDATYDREISLIKNARRAFQTVELSFIKNDEFKEKTKADPKQLKLYHEIIRALSTLEEVEFVRHQASKDVVGCDNCSDNFGC